jgi:GNAT superfamily N-acetyltransferase
MGETNATAFVVIDHPADARLEAVATLYAAAFPASERKPIGFLAEAAGRSDYRLFVTGGTAPEGFAVAYRSPRHGFALLEYMAVDPGRRSGGLGTRLFETVAVTLGCPLLLEVEQPSPGTPGDALRARRIAFYARLGCRMLEGIDYAMPQIADEAPPPLALMLRGVAMGEPGRDTLALWLTDLYAGVYGRGADDPVLARVLASLQRGVTRY